MGSLGLSKASGILLIDYPTIKANKRIFSEVEKNTAISFEYEDKNDKPDP